MTPSSLIRRPATHVALVAALAGSLTRPAAAAAQELDSLATASARRFAVGVGLSFAQPVGDFRRNVEGAIGGGASGQLRLDPLGIVSLRADLDMFGYSRETDRTAITTFYSFNETTTYQFLVASIGPELSLPVGPVQPYVNGAIGFVHFWTSTSVDAYDGTQIVQQEQFSDQSRVYRWGGGLRFPLNARASGVPLLLDVGVRFNDGNSTRYLVKGDIVNDPGNPYRVIITPHESTARFWMYKAGVTFVF